MTTATCHAFSCDKTSDFFCYYHRPLIPVAIALATGILVGGIWPGHLPYALALGGLVLARVVYAWHRPDRATIAPFILVGMLGYALISPWLPTELPPNHITRYMDSQRWQIKGIVTQKLHAHHGRSRFLLQVNQLSDQQQAIAVTGCIRLTIAGELPNIDSGTLLTFTGRIRSFHNFNNPGGFDYRRHMLFQHVYGSAFVASDHLRISDSNAKLKSSAMMRYRAQARRLIEQVNDPTTQSVLKTILLGDRQAISQDVRHLFNRCGIGHLLAISGLHIGIIGGLAFAFGLWGLNWWPAVLERGWGRRGAALLAIGTMVFYASLAGLAPATQRALIMILAFMITYFVYHEGDTLNFLALAAVLMLLWDPPVLFSISFQMSFAAVFWIVVGLSTVKREKKSHSTGVRRWLKRIHAFLLMTFWATIGTLPFVMSYFQEISLIGLATNCIMVPLIGFFVLPCGLLGLMLFPLNGVFAGWCLQAAGWGLAQALDGLQVLNKFDGIALSTFVPTVFEITCYYGVLGLILMRRRIKGARWLFLLAAVVITADGGYWLHERFWHDDLRVTVLDVGQGSAALVEFPGGKTMLIDGGGFTDNRIFDVGQRIIAPFLRYRKILRIDTIVLSHPSSDHMNGLVYVLSHFRPQKLLWTGERASTASFANFQQALTESGTQAPDFSRLNRRITIGGANVMILHPEISRMQGLHRSSGGDCNNHSLVIKVAMGNCGILFPGDIEMPAEKRLIDCCRQNVASQVLVAPHHGSRTSSSKGFLDAVRPEKVVISAGWRNRFGFPHKTVLKRYQALGSEVFRTDNQGAVLLRTDGHRWWTTTQLKYQ